MIRQVDPHWQPSARADGSIQEVQLDAAVTRCLCDVLRCSAPLQSNMNMRFQTLAKPATDWHCAAFRAVGHRGLLEIGQLSFSAGQKRPVHARQQLHMAAGTASLWLCACLRASCPSDATRARICWFCGRMPIARVHSRCHCCHICVAAFGGAGLADGLCAVLRPRRGAAARRRLGEQCGFQLMSRSACKAV